MNNVNQSVSGGIGGFVTFFVLALALWFLVRNMNVRLRNVAYREEAERRAQEEAEQGPAAHPGTMATDAPEPDVTVRPDVTATDPTGRRDVIGGQAAAP